MPVSKTAALEKRIEKLEQELAAYKRQLTKREPGANAAAREVSRTFVALWWAVEHFFETAKAHDVRWNVHPDVSAAYQAVADLMKSDPPSKRTPQ